MSCQSNHRLPRVVTAIGLSVAVATLVTGCGMYALGNQTYEYSGADSEYLTEQPESGALSPNTLLTDLYGSPIEVRILPHVADVPLAGAGVTTSYVHDPANAEIFSVRGVNADGELVGILGSQPPQAGQVGPVSGTLGTLEEGNFKPLASPSASQPDSAEYTIGQVATTEEAIIWSQAPAGSEDWQVFYQDGSGTQQNLRLPGTPWTLLDQSLQMRSRSDGDLIMVGAQKPGDPPGIRYLVQKLGDDPQDLILDGQDLQFLKLTTQGLLTVSSNQGPAEVRLRSLFWLSGAYYMEPLRYRDADQIHDVASAGPVVAISGVNGADSWVDTLSLDFVSQATRVPISGPASSLQVCGSRVGWIAENANNVPTAYLLDTTSNEVVVLPTTENAGELFCSANSFAVTSFDAEGTYLGTEVTKFN